MEQGKVIEHGRVMEQGRVMEHGVCTQEREQLGTMIPSWIWIVGFRESQFVRVGRDLWTWSRPGARGMGMRPGGFGMCPE